MQVWIANKAELAWLIDPIDKNSYVFHSNGTTQTYYGFDVVLKGYGPVNGFELNLQSINS